jgi:hypothetical protein
MDTVILPETEIEARRLRWEVVSTQMLGGQTRFRLRGLENAVLGKELYTSCVRVSPPNSDDLPAALLNSLCLVLA